MKRILKLILRFLVPLLVIISTLGIFQSLPIMILKNPGMESIKGDYVRVYYDKDDLSGGQEVFDFLEKEFLEVKNQLGFENKEIIDVYVYKDRKSFYIRKYGLVSLIVIEVIDGYWYKGDNKGVKALVVSPNSLNPKTLEKYDMIGEVAMHEVVHSMNYAINENLSYFLDNGVAQFLAKQKHNLSNTVNRSDTPTFEFIKSENQIKFANGGYEYSYLYIEYINEVYGWDAVNKLVEGRSYEEIFDKSQRDIYVEWSAYLNSYRKG